MQSSLMQATIELPNSEIEEIVRRVLEAMQDTGQADQDPEAIQTRQTLQRINAKEFITIREAAFLLSCSRGHVDNLIGKARDAAAVNPIPFRDLDGLVVFNREDLLTWTQQAKESRRRKVAA